MLLSLTEQPIHSRYGSPSGREAAQLCMIGCTAVLSHSHRHAFDLSLASKVLSKHCKESLSKCPRWHTWAATGSSYSARGSSKYLLLYEGEIRTHGKNKENRDAGMYWHIGTRGLWCIITINWEDWRKVSLNPFSLKRRMKENRQKNLKEK